MRRILIFSLVYYPRYVGGAEVAVKEITDRLGNDLAFDMITMRTDRARSEKIGNVQVYRVGIPWYGSPASPFFFICKYFFMVFALWKALRLHSSQKYDVIWPIMANYASAPTLFFKVLQPQVKLLLTLQEGDPFSHIKRRLGLAYPFWKMLFRKADHIQAISVYLANWARENGAKCPVTVVPNAVDYERFSKKVDEAEKDKIRQQLDKREGDVYLVTTSRLVEKNGVDDIIQSLVFLPQNVRLLILGEGESGSELKRLCEKLNVKDRVHFQGYVPHEKMLAYLQVSDIFVRPSRSEGFGNSFIEAMASELPVIATPVGGIVDFLRNGETGLFCEVRNPKSIADEVMKILGDPALRGKIVREARQMVRERYSWGKIALEMKRILISV